MLAIVFSLLCLLVAVRQKLHVNAYKDELGIILQEASAVKEELESIMNNTVELSRNVTDDIDCRLQEYRDFSVLHSVSAPVESTQIQKTPESDMQPSHPSRELPAEPSRRRVYEVARDMNISSRELLERLRSNGIQVKNHLSLIEPDALSGCRTDPPPPDCHDVKDMRPLLAAAPDPVPGAAQAGESEDFSLEELLRAHPYIAVRTLYERGYQVWEIAKILGRGQGEVNLILNITRKKQAQSI